MGSRTEIATLGEFGLIRHLTEDIKLKNESTLKGIGDDAAVLDYQDKLTLVTTLVSNMYLGMGLWTFFQILAWIVICLLTQCMGDFYRRRNKKPSLLVMAVFSLVMGYVFGLIVSLEQFVIGGLPLFIVYYSAGLLFDTFHAVGNFFFYLIGAPLLWKVFKKYRKC